MIDAPVGRLREPFEFGYSPGSHSLDVEDIALLVKTRVVGMHKPAVLPRLFVDANSALAISADTLAIVAEFRHIHGTFEIGSKFLSTDEIVFI